MQLDIYSEAYRRDPYATFQQFRVQAPISRIRPQGHWAFFNFKEVQWILKEPALFSSVLSKDVRDVDDKEFLVHARSLLGMDNLNTHACGNR